MVYDLWFVGCEEKENVVQWMKINLLKILVWIFSASLEQAAGEVAFAF